jgi:hypothetical protein
MLINLLDNERKITIENKRNCNKNNNIFDENSLMNFKK